MMIGKTGRECRSNCSKIALRYSRTELHPVRMEGLESPKASPGFEDPFVFQEGQQKVLVIPCQGNDGCRPLATRKLFDDAHGAKAAVDIVAQEHGHGMVEGWSFDIGLDALSHLPQQVIATMDISHAVHSNAIRNSTLLW